MLYTKDLKAGDRVRLLSFGQTMLSYRRQMLSLGITPGVEVSVIRRAPFGCPIQVIVRGIALIFRESEASELLWEHV